MQIRVNGEAKHLSSSIPLHQLLQDLKVATTAVAIAVNTQVIPRSEFEKTTIQENDVVEIVRAVGGG